ncbi:hypothetical protein HJC23_000559 [Cyclotella cryptica]|uniref:ESF1 RRM domain-containing protein n=1 Tax=Cyclotella cryptica TaxID=29204 RepID=A0ABD3PSW7_9STRA
MFSKKQKAPQARSSNAASNRDIIDERFVAATTRPQFKSGRKLKKDKGNGDSDNDAEGGNLIAIKSQGFEESFGESLTAAIQSDSRFAEALTNQEKFGCIPLMDKYGRKKKHLRKKSKSAENNVTNEKELDEDGDGTAKGKETSKDKNRNVPESNDMESRIAYLNALSRGEISVSSSDGDSDHDSGVDSSAESEQDSDYDSSASVDLYGKAGVFDPSYNQLPGDLGNAHDDEDGVELTDCSTPYMAILNLDWTNIRAVDVYAMLQSFCPPGTLKKVEIYPSDFGMEMMEKERIQGPSGLWKKPKEHEKSRDDVSESDETSGSEQSEGNESDSIGDNQSHESAAAETDEDNVSADEEEDIMNLNEATAKLYSHFPPQSEVIKNSRKSREDSDEEGFDREKLRAYEAAKLRYYFAIATFSSPSAAESVYNNVDGMEMEHSAAEIDVRALPADEYSETIKGRELRDQCDHLPGKYTPPDTVVAALRQSRVSCSWETGDSQREKKLTRYGMAKDAWQALAEGDDIKFYLASDHSSANDDSDREDSESDEEATETLDRSKGKAAHMRSLLGLGGSDEDENTANSSDGGDEDSHSSSSSVYSQSDRKGEPSEKQATFIPGKGSLEEKIRSKIQNTGGESEELTPFQKYLEKRKQKRKERREASRNKRRGVDDQKDEADENDGMYGYDPEFGVAKFSDDEASNGGRGDEKGADSDDFFLGGDSSNRSNTTSKKTKPEQLQKSSSEAAQASTKEELELLIAGDDDEEHIKDYDMRGLAKLERHAGKKLKGKRKRQMETLAANVSGQEFQIDTTDDRFAVLLDGTDDRFGIDRTNPLYKETAAMKALLEEQTKRRKKSRGKKDDTTRNNEDKEELAEPVNGTGGWVESSNEAKALSSLVKSLQRKVPSTNSTKHKV